MPKLSVRWITLGSPFTPEFCCSGRTVFNNPAASPVLITLRHRLHAVSAAIHLLDRLVVLVIELLQLLLIGRQRIRARSGGLIVSIDGSLRVAWIPRLIGCTVSVNLLTGRGKPIVRPVHHAAA